MARRKTYAPLNVFLNGKLVGLLSKETSGATTFQYATDWLTWPSAFPVSLSLPLREDRYVGAPVINVFENLLPDSDVIRTRVAERVGAAGTDAYDLLTALGHDCVGALQFLPDGLDPAAGSTDGTPISHAAIADIIKNLASAPLGMSEDDDFRISIAGAQEKTALLRKGRRWFRPSGTTATTHIFKPQIGRLPIGIDLSNSVENEYLCLKLLAAFGLPTAAVEMADFGGRRTLIVERFDRLWTKDGRLLRLPQEDCCQALSVPPTRKYQSEGGPGMNDIIALLEASDSPEADIASFIRANIMFWLLAATDGHAKNFSIFLNPGGRYRMTPLYDVLSAQPSMDADQIPQRKFKLAMSVGKNRHYPVSDIVPRHFLQTAAMSKVSASMVTEIFGDIAENAERWTRDVLDALPPQFPEETADAITEGIKQRLRFIDMAANQKSVSPCS